MTIKSMMACALFAAALPCAPSRAQAGTDSRITMYGRFDTGLEYISGVRAADGARRSRWSGESGDWGASWLGWTGTEQLGDGQAIVFWLEQGLDLSKGASAVPGQPFNRKATVSWRSPGAGTFTLGRDILMSNTQWDMDPMMNELSSGTTLMRSRNALVGDNLVAYQSPVVDGFDLLGQYGLDESHGAGVAFRPGGTGRIRALQLTYTAASVQLRAQWNDLYDQNGKLSNIFTASRETFLGLGWNLTPALKLQAAWNHLTAPDTLPGLANRADHVRIGGRYQPVRQVQYTAGLYHIQVRGGAGDATHDGAGHATLLAAGALYFFSPITFAYVSVSHVHNGQGSDFSVGGYLPGTDSLNNPAQGHGQNGLYLGLVTGF